MEAGDRWGSRCRGVKVQHPDNKAVGDLNNRCGSLHKFQSHLLPNIQLSRYGVTIRPAGGSARIFDINLFEDMPKNRARGNGG
jgi:hypothetical protein